MPDMVGETRLHDGQTYVAIDSFERDRKDGTVAVILKWQSACVQCGELFVFTAPAAAAKFNPNRRCQKHKRPGFRVKGGGACGRGSVGCHSSSKSGAVSANSRTASKLQPSRSHMPSRRIPSTWLRQTAFMWSVRPSVRTRRASSQNSAAGPASFAETDSQANASRNRGLGLTGSLPADAATCAITDRAQRVR